MSESTLVPCGTLSAVKRHHRHHEPLCDPCAAVSKAERSRRNAEDYANGKEPRRQARRVATAKAHRILADRHFLEWELLLADTIQDELESRGLLEEDSESLDEGHDAAR